MQQIVFETYKLNLPKVLLKIQWIFVIVLSFFVIRNFRVQAHLLNC